VENFHPSEDLKSYVSVLHRVSQLVSSAVGVDDLLRDLIALSIRVARSDACLVYLLEPETGDLVLRASQLPHASEIGRIRLKAGEGVTGWVADHKQVVALADSAASDSRFKRFAALTEDTYEAFLSVPLVSGGETIGVLNVHHRSAHQHSAEEIALLTFIGEQLGVAIARHQMSEHNAQLQEQAEKLRDELETRKVVERAKGILQSRNNLTEEQAYLALRNESRRMRRPMKELAQAIILAEEMTRMTSESSTQPAGSGT
jgi:uroporphyrinogen-III synthase